MKFFGYDQNNGILVLNDPSILLVNELGALLAPERNKTTKDKAGKNKDRAFREFKYIYLFIDWESPYFQFSEKERHDESLLDAKLTQEEFDDPIFREACKKYDKIQNSSKIAKLLKASYNMIDKITEYLDNVDLDERDPVSGKPIFKTKDVIMEIASASKLIDSINTLEIEFKKETEASGGLRGDKIPGMFD